MQPELFEIPSDIVVMGMQRRTSAAAAAQDIPALWQRFMGEGIAARLPRRSDDDGIYAVYCDYESDFRGAYTLVLGVAVEASALIVSGMRRVRIVEGRYARFFAQGDPRQVIWQTWAAINQRQDEGDRRRYVADFERYRPSTMTADAVEAEVVVGLA